jgi:hypothetical protein
VAGGVVGTVPGLGAGGEGERGGGDGGEEDLGEAGHRGLLGNGVG